MAKDTETSLTIVMRARDEATREMRSAGGRMANELKGFLIKTAAVLGSVDTVAKGIASTMMIAKATAQQAEALQSGNMEAVLDAQYKINMGWQEMGRSLPVVGEAIGKMIATLQDTEGLKRMREELKGAAEAAKTAQDAARGLRDELGRAVAGQAGPGATADYERDRRQAERRAKLAEMQKAFSARLTEERAAEERYMTTNDPVAKRHFQTLRDEIGRTEEAIWQYREEIERLAAVEDRAAWQADVQANIAALRPTLTEAERAFDDLRRDRDRLLADDRLTASTRYEIERSYEEKVARLRETYEERELEAIRERLRERRKAEEAEIAAVEKSREKQRESERKETERVLREAERLEEQLTARYREARGEAERMAALGGVRQDTAAFASRFLSRAPTSVVPAHVQRQLSAYERMIQVLQEIKEEFNQTTMVRIVQEGLN